MSNEGGRAELTFSLKRRAGVVDAHIFGTTNATQGEKVQLKLIPDGYRPEQTMIAVPLVGANPNDPASIVFIHSNGAAEIYGVGKSVTYQGHATWLAPLE